MPKELAKITLVRDGVEVRDVRETVLTAAWWVVRVRDAECPAGLWCVYGGQPGTVLACLRNHGPYTDAVAYPFDDGQASMLFRDKIEKKYMPAFASAVKV